jgi:hypothetical protein
MKRHVIRVLSTLSLCCVILRPAACVNDFSLRNVLNVDVLSRQLASSQDDQDQHANAGSPGCPGEDSSPTRSVTSTPSVIRGPSEVSELTDRSSASWGHR